MENSKIEWCDHTFNPWEGCTKVSPGCAYCYAENRNARFGGGTAPNWGPGAPRRRTSEANWKQPLKWDAKFDHDLTLAHGMDMNLRRPRVFCASLADWLDEEVPIKWLHDLLVLILNTPNLDWLLLTKRPHLWRSRLEAFATMDGSIASAWAVAWLGGEAPKNVWIGTSVEDQKRADERIPHLLKIPARVRFLSMEPLLGPVDLMPTGALGCDCPQLERDDGETEERCSGRCQFYRNAVDKMRRVEWVITGGESGPGARPSHPDWFRSIRDQCKAAGVAYLHKQNGEWVKYIDRDREDPDWQKDYRRIGVTRGFVYLNLAGGCGFHGERFHVMERVGKAAAGRLLDGVEHNEFPEVSS